jgi:hypothetical protein
LEGKRAGLQTAASLREETRELKAKEKTVFSQVGARLPPSLSSTTLSVSHFSWTMRSRVVARRRFVAVAKPANAGST